MSASWLKRALVTSALAAGAMMLSGGVANAGVLPGGAPDPVSSILQDQTASNTNSTDQDADATASTDQVNINAPISILSSGANGGDVDQSNQADTDATAGNGNWTDQAVDQSQTAVLDGGPGSGSIDQSQTGTNSNDTTQTSDADASTGQWNINVPVSILSSGSKVRRCRSVEHGLRRTPPQRTTTGPTRRSTRTRAPTRRAATGAAVTTVTPRVRSRSTRPAPTRTDTSQTAGADASTGQWNINAPISILSSGSNGSDGCGCYSSGHGGGVDQSNDADTTATAGNLNWTDQTVSQDQDADLQGGGVSCWSCGSGAGSIDELQTGSSTTPPIRMPTPRRRPTSRTSTRRFDPEQRCQRRRRHAVELGRDDRRRVQRQRHASGRQPGQACVGRRQRRGSRLRSSRPALWLPLSVALPERRRLPA